MSGESSTLTPQGDVRSSQPPPHSPLTAPPLGPPSSGSCGEGASPDIIESALSHDKQSISDEFGMDLPPGSSSMAAEAGTQMEPIEEWNIATTNSSGSNTPHLGSPQGCSRKRALAPDADLDADLGDEQINKRAKSSHTVPTPESPYESELDDSYFSAMTPPAVNSSVPPEADVNDDDDESMSSSTHDEDEDVTERTVEVHGADVLDSHLPGSPVYDPRAHASISQDDAAPVAENMSVTSPVGTNEPTPEADSGDNVAVSSEAQPGSSPVELSGSVGKVVIDLSQDSDDEDDGLVSAPTRSSFGGLGEACSAGFLGFSPRPYCPAEQE